MLNYNEIKDRKYIVLEDEPYEVVSSVVSRKQANKPVLDFKEKDEFAEAYTTFYNESVL